ncbi:MAG: MBOAT family protein [Flavobacteriales bacterium]|jgi:D-alanyl-lipoteichoic acid acyltransferase DltB (MBOAT superfamily)|nr:MBOAT family protein [Flavobacteriales bacterium]
MVFNSIEFLLFAILFFLLWPVFRKKDHSRWFFITAASFLFYGWWDWRFLFLIIGSGLIDFVLGYFITQKPQSKKTFLFLSVFGNLLSLSVFKYSHFFAQVIEDFISIFNFDIDLIAKIPDFALITPVGISFYTFQSLSYTVDIYRGRLKPTKNLLHFFSYLSMFPQLVAGPIVRAKDFLYQLKSYRIPTEIEKWNAMKLICFGLFQKMVIADNLSFFIDSAYEGKSSYDNAIYWWTVSIAFAFQIYSDFSGYSLIARGLAKLMGYHFKANFNHPYLAKSLKEFWSKWHISLSTWFRDYVYIPMGGSRNGMKNALIALTTTMLLSGIWHGANYTFIVWALIHILFLTLERLTKWNKKWITNPTILLFLTFIQVTIAWVYFRSDNISQANSIIMKLFRFDSFDLRFFNAYFDNLIFLFLAIIIEFFIKLKQSNYTIKKLYYQNNLDVISVTLAILAILLFRGAGQQFIYFQF